MKGIITTALVMVLFMVMAVISAEESIRESLYKKKCTTCHGQDGKGKPALAAMFKIGPEKLDLTTSEVKNDTDEELLKVINDGLNNMPAYDKQLTKEEQQKVLEYIRQLGGK